MPEAVNLMPAFSENESSLAVMLDSYAVAVEQQFKRAQSQAPDLYQTTTQVASSWAWYVSHFLSLGPSSLYARRGIWKLENSPLAVPDPLVKASAKVVASVAVRGIGSRLERGMQFRVAVDKERMRQRMVRELVAIINAKCVGRGFGERDGDDQRGLLEFFHSGPNSLDARQESVLSSLVKRLLPVGEESDKILRIFFELWDYVFSHWDSRGSTLGAESLKVRSLEKNKILLSVVDTGRGKNDGCLPLSWNSTARDITRQVDYRVLVDKNDARALNPAQLSVVRQKVFVATCMGLSHLIGNKELAERCCKWLDQDDASNEVIRHYGQRILTALRGGNEHAQELWGDAIVRLRQLNYLSASLVANSKLWEHDQWEHGQGGARRDTWEEKLRWIDLLQRFLLQHQAHGKYFYFLSSRSINTTLHTSFSIGTLRPLETAELGALVRIVGIIFGALDDRVFENVNIRYSGPLLRLDGILGSKVREKLLGRCRGGFDDPVIGGLPHYLAFAESLSNRAWHEGKRLGFDIAVTDGVRRYEQMETVCSFERDEDRDEAWVTVEASQEYELARNGQLNGQTSARPNVNLELAARMLGNYAFLQRPGVVLVGNRSGRLLAVGKFASGSVDPQGLTAVDGADAMGHRGCYLVRIAAEGEILVFHRGELILRRSHGRYAVIGPDEFGVAYIAKLAAAIQEFLEDAPESCDAKNRGRILYPQVVARVVWRISQRRGAGGCIVIGDAKRLSDLGFRLAVPFPHAEGFPLAWAGQEQVFEDLCVQDGGTVIDSATGMVSSRLYFRAGDVSASDLEDIRKRDKRLYPEVLHWGTRHFASLELGHCLRDEHAMIIVVSSDGDIHVISGGRIDDALSLRVNPWYHETESAGREAAVPDPH